MKSSRLYKVTPLRDLATATLVRAPNRERVSSYCAGKTFAISVATDQDIYDLAKLGVQIEDAAGGEGTT